MDWALTVATVGLIIAVCYLLDWLVSKKEEDKQKEAIIKWWSRMDDFSYSEAVYNSNIFCNEMFDKIYGKRHFSLRCVGISCCISISSVFILTFIASRIVGIEYTYLLLHDIKPLGFIISSSVFINCWVDYISLIETRIILRFTTRIRPIMLPVLLLVDFFLSALVFLLGLETFYIVMGFLESKIVVGSLESDYYIELLILDEVWSIVDWSNPDQSTIFYSTFSTSVIFYFYCLSTLLFKFLKLPKKRIMVVLEKLENSDHLFKALGGFLAAVVLFVKCVVEVVQQIRQIW